MPTQYVTDQATQQAPSQVAQGLGDHLHTFLLPLLILLDRAIDVRLVRTFAQTVQVLIEVRNQAQGLLLSELGGYLLTPDKAPAGTKRLSNLLHCSKWASGLIEQFLWQQADQELDRLHAHGETGLCVWDESVLEKPESLKLEGLCAVKSSRAARLKRIKPGFYNPPGGRPIFVPGMQWLTVLLMGRTATPKVAIMTWWTTRGRFAQGHRQMQTPVLERLAGAWGERVIHVFDRGWAGGSWLQILQETLVRFIERWPKHYQLWDPTKGKERKAWEIVRGKRSWDTRQVWDAHLHRERSMGVVVAAVRHSDYAAPLWLVVARSGGGREPWYLLTNEAIRSPEDAWRVVFAYARRWQIEMCFRYGKSELAMESPRLWDWESRLKLLLLVTLAYAFLLSLLHDAYEHLREWLLRNYCHRTGKRHREAKMPLYRLRWALSRLWQTHHPTICLVPSQRSG